MDTSTQDRFTALESLPLLVERLAGEVAVLQNTLRVSQARIAKLEELVAHRPACGIHGDPCRAAAGSIITTRFPYQSKSLDLLSLPDEVLYMIIDQVATVNRYSDDGVHAMPSRFYELDTAPLISLSCTSKAMQQHVMPALWRHITVDSPARMLRLTKAVKNSDYRRHVPSIRWRSAALDHCTLETVRAALLELCQGASVAHLPPLDSATSLLTKDQSVMFAAQIIAVSLRELTALQALTSNCQLLSVVLCLRPEGFLPNQLTHVRVNKVSETTRTESILSQNDFIASQAPQMLRPSHGNVFDLFQQATQQRQFRPLHSSWSGQLSLHTTYDSLVKDASDAAMAISTLQALVNSAAGLYGLHLISSGRSRIRPETVIPFVTFPVTLKIVNVEERSNSALNLVTAVSHIGSLRYLKIYYSASNFAPEALPPALMVLKVNIREDQSFKMVASILRSLRHKLLDDRYPKTLVYIALDSTSLSTLAGQQTLAKALLTISKESAIDAEFTDLAGLLAAVLALDDACRERGIKLCGPNIAKPLLGPTFREVLPYKLMGQVIAKLNSIEGGAAT